MRARFSWSKALPWVVTVALLSGAWVIAEFTLPESASERPFVQSTQVGDRAVGRNIAVTVLDVQAARTITTDDGWSASGSWVVIELEAAAVVQQTAAALNGATLQIDGVTYSASERVTSANSLYRTSLVPGVARHGVIAFEIAPDMLTGTGLLQLSLSTDTRLESVIELEIDLGSLPVHDEVALIPTDWAKP